MNLQSQFVFNYEWSSSIRASVLDLQLIQILRRRESSRNHDFIRTFRLPPQREKVVKRVKPTVANGSGHGEETFMKSYRNSKIIINAN